MHQEHEAELRRALAEGLLSREEVEALREEALRLGRGPLSLLKERGRLSEETLVGLLRGAAQTPLDAGEDPAGAPTLERAPAEPERPREAPAFPVPGWERYQGIRFLGQGGMGQVFLAYDPRLHRSAALKFMRGNDPELSGRFLTEARAQARVDHACVCQVYEVGEVRGQPFIAMQYVEGQPLHLLAGRLTTEQKALVLRDAAEGVHAAHRAGLIHRDLKPSNILVERQQDGRLKPYVMDFGLARDWNEGTTATGSVLGTPHYMAPEQARGEVGRLDRRADVYALGATLYHLLTGQPPIPGANALEVLSHVATLEPRPPRALDPDVPVDLEAIVLKCLEKDRSARYGSARALAEDLERFLSGEPVRARPMGLMSRLRRKARKHRLVVGVASVALLAVTLALGWAVSTRREAARREVLARRFTEQVERIEALARYSGLTRLHDTRADRAAIRARMEVLDAEIVRAGESGVGPGHYALGRGYLALGEDAKAREHLEVAWRHGFREPRVAWTLALVLGRLYREQLLEVERLRGAERREARRGELQRRYRDPALAYLRESGGPEVPSADYVAALVALYEDRFDEALARLDAMGEQLPWFFEAPQLRGDIFRLRAARRWNQGDRDGALADFEAGRRAYTDAAALGESVPDVHQALAKLEYTAMVMELYGRGEVLPPFTRGMEAVARALEADPEHLEARVQQARFYNRLAEDAMNRGDDVEQALLKGIAAAREALALHPDSSRARLELAQGLWRQALSFQARGRDPGEPLRQALSTLEGIAPAERDYEFHATLGLVYKIQADYEDQTGADSLLHRGRAIDAYREAIHLDERLPDAWINLGLACLARASNPRAAKPLDDLEQARAALEKSRALNPQNYVPYFLGGTLHGELASRRRDSGGDARPDLAAALDLFQRGLDINASIPQLHNGKGSTLLELARETWARGGDPFPELARAQAAYAQAIAVAPKQGYGQSNLGELQATRALYQYLRGEDPAAEARAAEAISRDAIGLLPGLSDPWVNLARVHHLQALWALDHERDPRPALTKLEDALVHALERNRDDAQAWRYQGEARAVRGRWLARHQPALADEVFEQAAASFEKALALKPSLQDARLALGHLCREWARCRKGAGLLSETEPSHPRP